MGEAACRGPRERHSPGPNLALNGPDQRKPTFRYITEKHIGSTPRPTRSVGCSDR